MIGYTLYHNVDKRRHADNIWGEYRPGDRLAPYYTGEIGGVTEGDGSAWFIDSAHELYAKHNRDSRPCGRLGPSLSIGDVIFFDGGPAFAVALEGFDTIDPDTTLVLLPQTYLEWLEAERNNPCQS